MWRVTVVKWYERSGRDDDPKEGEEWRDLLVDNIEYCGVCGIVCVR